MQEKTTTYYRQKVDDVLLYINNHLGENLGIKELAEYAGISFFHFHRILKAALNEPLGNYIDRVRLDTAVKLIRYSDEPLTNIPGQIGFNDLSSFSKAFSREFGISPQEFKTNKEIVLNTHVDYRIDDEGEIISDIKPKFIVLPKRPIAYIRIKGEYGGTEVEKSWDRLLDFAIKNNLIGWKPELFSIYYDDPDEVGIENCISDVCFTTKKIIEKNDVVSFRIIEGGNYAVFRYKGSYEHLWELYDSIYRNWLFNSDVMLSDLPTIEKYLNYSPRRNPDDLLTEIYIPVEKVI